MKLRQIISLSLVPTLYVIFVLLLEFVEDGLAQNPDPLFEIPVQLIGFPAIILSVRLAQFARKLAYSLNPNTYVARSKRDASAMLLYDVDMAQKEIIREFGPNACIMEEPCRVHASRPGRLGAHPPWHDILRHYKVQSTGMKQWYLLSLFIGDAVRDVPLCKHLSKRMPCPGVGPLPPPQPR